MIRIRKGIFETNSSSNDYYYDDDDYIDYPENEEFLIRLNIDIESENIDCLDNAEFMDILKESFDIIIKDPNFKQDTYIDNLGIKECEIEDGFDGVLWCFIKLLNKSDAWLEQEGSYCPPTITSCFEQADPGWDIPTIFGQKLPEWNDKYTKELEILLKKSKYGNYIKRIKNLEVDIDYLKEEIASIYDDWDVVFETPTNKNFKLF